MDKIDQAAHSIAIKYVGLKTAGEGAFGELTGGIVWMPDVVHNVSPAVASKLLQHPDVFARDDGKPWPHHDRQAPVQVLTTSGPTMAQRVAAAAGEPDDTDPNATNAPTTVAPAPTREYLDHLLAHDVAGDENADEFVGELRDYFGAVFTADDERYVRAKCAGETNAPVTGVSQAEGSEGERVQETVVSGNGAGVTLAPGAAIAPAPTPAPAPAPAAAKTSKKKA
jgi:hypothetical protein